MCQVGLKLHKVMSNSKEVLKAIPAEERAKDVKDFDFEKDHYQWKGHLELVSV